MSELQAFRTSVEQFLQSSGWAPTRLGKEAAGDPLFVFQLRKGREPRNATRQKVSEFIERASREVAA